MTGTVLLVLSHLFTAQNKSGFDFQSDPWVGSNFPEISRPHCTRGNCCEDRGARCAAFHEALSWHVLSSLDV